MLYDILTLLTATAEQILTEVETELASLGYEVSKTPDDMFVFGVPPTLDKSVTTPLLCAHVDLVGVVSPKKEDIILDFGQNRISLNPKSEASCLGADDRAGIYAMFKLLRSLSESGSILPFVVTTNFEEVSGIGAQAVANSDLLQTYENNVSCYIELDRRRSGEFVSYDPSGYPNEELGQMFKEQGFTLGSGSYSDVADFTPITNTSNVNISVGYRNEHSKNEVLFLDELELTVTRVLRMWEYCPELFTKIFEAEESDGWWDMGDSFSGENWDYDGYHDMMDSVYQLSEGLSIDEDIPMIVHNYLEALPTRLMNSLVENLEEVVQDLECGLDEIERQIAKALVSLLIDDYGKALEEELDYLEGADGFCVNSRGTVVGRTMNKAGGF